eukprot:CAMPEP_0178770396 /NCGR_PEP_ID=MMETSP0744-20121128/21372_1 /TAXON_ID=913974 /ORGANISM="Nitzschia punctata, Strain CCMP561" /LENGTH=37 /DNA_ID= /DNA_START= /DNA_END= /DNA_ORIENTATION=
MASRGDLSLSLLLLEEYPCVAGLPKKRRLLLFGVLGL